MKEHIREKRVIKSTKLALHHIYLMCMAIEKHPGWHLFLKGLAHNK